MWAAPTTWTSPTMRGRCPVSFRRQRLEPPCANRKLALKSLARSSLEQELPPMFNSIFLVAFLLPGTESISVLFDCRVRICDWTGTIPVWWRARTRYLSHLYRRLLLRLWRHRPSLSAEISGAGRRRSASSAGSRSANGRPSRCRQESWTTSTGSLPPTRFTARRRRARCRGNLLTRFAPHGRGRYESIPLVLG